MSSMRVSRRKSLSMLSTLLFRVKLTQIARKLKLLGSYHPETTLSITSELHSQWPLIHTVELKASATANLKYGKSTRLSHTFTEFKTNGNDNMPYV